MVQLDDVVAPFAVEGVPSAVLSAAGVPSAVLSAAGVPSAVLSAEGVPSAVLSAEGVPSAGMEALAASEAHIPAQHVLEAACILPRLPLALAVHIPLLLDTVRAADSPPYTAVAVGDSHLSSPEEAAENGSSWADSLVH